MINRRTFLRNAGAGIAALAAAGRWNGSLFANPYGLPVGLQLYTVRRQMEKDPAGTLKQVAATGYQEVEVDGASLPKLLPLIQGAGLNVCAAHYDFGHVKSGWEKEVESAGGADMKYMVVSFIGPRERKTLDDYKRIALFFSRDGELCHKAGMQFCYHAHNFEFKNLGGGLGYDVLLKESDPRLVKFELDCFWMTHAGYDPVQYMRNYPGRFPLLHIKDLKAGIPTSTNFDNPKGNPFTEVGKGIIDWKKVFVAAKQGGLEHYYVEQDECDGPPLEAIKISYDYLHSLTV
jgi:sugar phosphate isomerase/epimerase